MAPHLGFLSRYLELVLRLGIYLSQGFNVLVFVAIWNRAQQVVDIDQQELVVP